MRRAVLALLVLSGCAAAPPAAPPDDPALAALFRQDQADRLGQDAAHWAGVARRDADRRRAVDSLVAAGALQTAADHYHAAMVYQHGTDSTHFARARALAVTAARMGSDRARWLAVASLDRLLLSTGHPQHYLTQFVETPTGWYLDHFDSTAVTDAERTRAGARTLDGTRAFLAHQNGTPAGSLAPPPEPEPHGETVELIGSVDDLVRQVVYPEAARAAGAVGPVRVQLTVQPDGSVTDVFVVDGLRRDLDAEVLRVVRQARFVNAVGQPWEIRLVLPLAPR